jgi:hypothetical protein
VTLAAAGCWKGRIVSLSEGHRHPITSVVNATASQLIADESSGYCLDGMNFSSVFITQILIGKISRDKK